MPDRMDSYVSQRSFAVRRRQAWYVVAAASTVAAFWVILILGAPLLRASGFENLSSTLIGFFSLICHQIPDRTFHILSHPMGVCSRCFGVYFGVLLGIVTYPLWRNVDEIEPLPRIWLFLALVPVGIDWSLTMFGIWENTFTTRFLSGLILGMACAIFIVPALVEIVRNFSRRSANSQPASFPNNR